MCAPPSRCLDMSSRQLVLAINATNAIAIITRDSGSLPNTKRLTTSTSDTDLGMPETISINGQSCLSRGSFVFVRIKGKGPSMPYSDFTLASCEIPEGEVILPTIRLKTKVAFYENRQLNYDYLWKDNELISSQIKQAHSYNTNFIEPSLQVQLANDKDKFDIWWYYTDLTNHAKLIQVVHGDYMDEASTERNFVIGECRYKVDNTQIYLTDLTKDTAHWHFIDDLIQVIFLINVKCRSCLIVW